jgi:NADH dehydrogenase
LPHIGSVHRVVIVGGGFGGLYAARSLRKAPVDVTLIDRRNFHLFQPLLYQVATGALSPGEIASPLRILLGKQRNVRVLLAEAVDLDSEQRLLLLADGSIPYDTLVIATGARNHYFGQDQWESVAPGLKSLEDAARIRRKILYAFEAAERETDLERRAPWLTFVVVGAGATGVELAGALAEIANKSLRNEFRNIRPEESRIFLVDASANVLNTFPDSLSASAERQLIRLGVQPRTGVRVTAIDEEGITLATARGEEHIATKTVLWAAGVRASDFGAILSQAAGAQLDRTGRVHVLPDLTVPNHPEIFVIGDLAALELNGHPVPGVAPAAMQQGRYAGRLIQARLRGRSLPPFRYVDKGMLAVIGRNAGVGLLKGLRLQGRIAWLAWLFVHLYFLSEAFNRVVVFLKWGYNYLTFNRSSLLITIDPRDKRS